MFSPITESTATSNYPYSLKQSKISDEPSGSNLSNLNQPSYFFFLRHSKTTWQKTQLKEGFIDSPLSTKGIEQTKEAAQKLSANRIKIIVSSPLKRCTETADIISEILGNRPIYQNNGIVSRDYGTNAYEKAGWLESSCTKPEESFEIFQTRVVNTVFQILKDWGNGVLFITHGCVEAALLEHLSIEATSIGPKAYASPILFERTNTGWVACRVAETIKNSLPIIASCLRVEPADKAFYFLRHGRTDWNKEMIELGPQDLPLNEEGIKEVTAALPELSTLKISKIVTSELRRCVESAQIIAQRLNNISIIIEPQLKERYFGNWSMQKDAAEELKKESKEGPGFFASIKEKVEKMLPPDAEERGEFQKRIVRYLNGSQFNAEGEGTLIIAHGCVRDVLLDYMNLSENRAGEKKYGKPLIFEPKKDGTWCVRPVEESL